MKIIIIKTQGQFYVEFNELEFSFPSRMVAIPKLKSLLIYSLLEGE